MSYLTSIVGYGIGHLVVIYTDDECTDYIVGLVHTKS